jgi:hypothetical protein
MPENVDPAVGPLDPIVARNQRSAKYRGSTPPPPDEAALLLSKLVTANIDKAVRECLDALGDVPLHPAQVDYLTRLIASAGAR